MSDDKHCTEISLEEAIHLTQRYINQYKAFEKVHGVLKLAQAAEQMVKEARVAQKSLDSDIDTKRGLLAELEKTIEAAEPAKDAATKSLAEHTERIHHEHTNTLEKAQDELNDILESLVVKRREAEEAHTLAMNDLAADEKSAQARVDDLNKSLTELTKKVRAITGEE